MYMVNTGLLLKTLSAALFLTLVYIYMFTWLILGMVILIGSSYRIRVDKVLLDDLEEHNVTLSNIIYLSLLHIRDLVIIAHTSNDTLVLSDVYNPILHFPFVISGLSRVVYVDGEFRLGLGVEVIKRFNIVVDKLEYNTCFPGVLRESITVLEEVNGS